MRNNPAIVVCAYNRPAALHRLLQSVSQARFPEENITLHISIDYSEDDTVKQLAESFNWPYGEKIITAHPQHLGLKAHVLSCGDLSVQYGAIIVLEDDLYVSPQFYGYALQALPFYEADESVAGISLYHYEVAESCFRTFKPVDDGSDVYFMQVASSWGQVWSKTRWLEFRNWFAAYPHLPENGTIPEYLKHWGKHSWKKHFIHYLIDQKKYFVFPRLSFTANFEEPGTNAKTKGIFLSTLHAASRDYRFKALQHSASVYDAWFEPEPAGLNKLQPFLSAYDYAVDLFGTKTKNSLDKPYLLTTRNVTSPVLGFDNALSPEINNVIFNRTGDAIHLASVASVDFSVSQAGNLLEFRNPESDYGINVVLVWDKEETEALKQSVNSFINQGYGNKQCILLTPATRREQAEKLFSYYNGLLQIICYDNLQFNRLCQTAIQNSSFGLLSWMRVGTILEPDALEKAASIFKAHGNISWVTGVNESCRGKEQSEKVASLPYRLTPSLAFEMLRKNKKFSDTELHFFRKQTFLHALKKHNVDALPHLFELLSGFQLHVAMYRFGIKKSQSYLNPNSTDTEKLMSRYHHFRRRTKLFSVLMDKLLRLPLINDGSWLWYLPVLKNYPDVLRYDDTHQRFYLTKY